jgi:AcrR family transcriptional regulator
MARDDDPTLVWERPEPPSRPALSPLSRDRIVHAAIELADAEGLGAVSLRKVAAELDAGPMRLYGYMSTKDELLDLMVDAVYGEIELPPDGDWRAVRRSLAHGIRQVAYRHEWFVDLLGGRPHLGPNALAYAEASMAPLVRVFDIDTAMRAAGTVNAYVIGAVRAEITERRAERASGMDERQWQAASGPYMRRMLATGRYPTFARVMRESSDVAPDVVFDTGLDYVLDGIARAAF